MTARPRKPRAPRKPKGEPKATRAARHSPGCACLVCARIAAAQARGDDGPRAPGKEAVTRATVSVDGPLAVRLLRYAVSQGCTVNLAGAGAIAAGLPLLDAHAAVIPHETVTPTLTALQRQLLEDLAREEGR